MTASDLTPAQSHLSEAGPGGAAFDAVRTPIGGPLLIEASAGTGKTYSLMALILRILVEKEIDLPKILVVTFTKSATYELSSRLRETLTEFTEKLQEADCDPALFKPADPLHKALLDSWNQKSIGPQKVLDLLSRALFKIDDASIFTIHGFCQRTLQDYVFSSHGNYGLELGAEDETLDETISVFLRKRAPLVYASNIPELMTGGRLDKPTWWKDILRTLTSRSRLTAPGQYTHLVEKFTATGVISVKPGEYEELMRLFDEFVLEAPSDYRGRLKNKGLFTFDDLLTETEARLAAKGADEPQGLIAQLREQYSAALIDEFQDTDPVQYSIFRRIFLDDIFKARDNTPASSLRTERPVIFVGDPKQSIYSFRNAELETYLQAKKDIGNTLALKQNFRSTPGVTKAVNILFSLASKSAAITDKSKKGLFEESPEPTEPKTAFINPGLRYSTVDFNPGKFPLMEEKPDGSLKALAPFSFKSNIFAKTPEGAPSSLAADQIRKISAQIIAEDIAALLNKKIFVGERPLQPSDIAILVRARNNARDIIKELGRRGIRVGIDSKDNVLASPEGSDISKIITAMSEPGNQKALSSARATKIFGETLRSIINDDRAAAAARTILEAAAAAYEKDGIAAAFAEIFSKCATEEKLLTRATGERELTNYQHILELLNEARDEAPTLAALLRWIQQAASEKRDDLMLRRESDADIVRIVTIHQSKGLQYPVVYLGDISSGSTPTKYIAKRKGPDGLEQLYCAISGSKSDPVEAEESCRLFYVACTRAAARLFVPFFVKRKSNGTIDSYTSGSPLTLALTGGEAPSSTLERAVRDLASDLADPANIEEVRKAAEALSKTAAEEGDRKNQCFEAVSRMDPFEFDMEVKSEESIPCTKYRKPLSITLRCGAGSSKRPDWGTSSFSGLTRNLPLEEHAVLTDEPYAEEKEDELSAFASFGEEHNTDELALIQKNQKANEFGTDLHTVMELVFNGSPDATSVKLERFINAKPQYYRGDNTKEDRALMQSVLTNLVSNVLDAEILKGHAPHFRLRSLEQAQGEKRPEFEFLLSVDAPEKGREKLTAELLAGTLSELDDRFKHLRLAAHELKGYLTGAVDLIFNDGTRYWVLDWKSNRLAEHPSEYTEEVMEQAMRKHHYHLQYLLYCVALKRYLQTRLGLSSEQALSKIAGAVYVFLRGIRKDSRTGALVLTPASEVIGCVDEFLTSGFSRSRLNEYKKALGKKDGHA